MMPSGEDSAIQAEKASSSWRTARGLLSHPRKRRRLIALEPLENRSLLTGQAFAIIDGSPSAAGSSAGVAANWFEAIDEPWKSNQNNSDTTNPQGIDGAEGHYGLWTYNSSGTDGQFVTKVEPASGPG